MTRRADSFQRRRNLLSLAQLNFLSLRAAAFFVALWPTAAVVSLLIGGGLWLLRLKADPDLHFRRLPFDRLVLLFAAISGLSVFVSPDVAFSFYNYYNLVGIYVVAYFLTGQLVKEEEALRRIGENTSRVRTVFKGLPYTLPPAQDKYDLFAADIEDIIARVQADGEAKLFQALIGSVLGFGPVSAKEIAFLAGLAPNVLVSTLDAADFAEIARALRELRAWMEQPAPSLRLDVSGKVTAMAAFPLSELPKTQRLSYPTVSALMIDADKRLGSYVIPDRERFRRLVRTELSRAREKYEKLGAEIAAAENAEEQKIFADNLMTYQYNYKDHEDDEITVANIYSETGETITIPLDRRIGIIANMQAYYKKYDKLKRAVHLLAVQQEHCTANIRHLESIEASLDSSTRLAEIAEIQDELITAGYLHEKLPKRSKDRRARPFSFTAPDGANILVGKNNAQNDALTFKTAAPTDIWLHVRDIPGSHVILRTNGDAPTEQALHLAAQIAAHFSKARGSSNVPVDYTAVRFVKKPSGAVPGFVRFINEKTLFVTEDEEELAPILAQDPTVG